MGFDAVEIHGAHGYLLDEFHWSRTNRRTDSYGGGIANRARLSAEVVAAIREAVGPGFPVIFRFSQWKGIYYNATMVDTPAELEEFLTPLAEAGVSVFHVSTRRYWLPAFEGSETTLAGWTRRITGVPVIGLGSVGVGAPYLEEGSVVAEPTLSLKRLVELVETGEFDLVGLGRAILADPDFVRKLAAGRPERVEAYVKDRELELR
jgi:2,4-dienoyl-CoA reductase-like NADH-dependent reductase (Old Yellow Enzyme family)